MVAPQSVRDGSDVGQQPRDVRVVGYLRGPAPDGLACESPLLVVVSSFGVESREYWPCNSPRSDRCRPCAARNGRRVRSVAAEGFTMPRSADDGYWFLTVTPPSPDPHCKKAGCTAAPYCRHEQCACTPIEGVDLAVWNPTAAACWNRLLLLIEREYGVRPEYFRSTEAQKRGGLHHHALLATVAKLDEKVVRRLAVQAGYGHEIKLEKVDQHSRALVEYVTKTLAGYVTKAAAERPDVPWARQFVDWWTGEVIEDTHPTYRTWSQSRGWGTTMQVVRQRARVKALELAALRQAATAPATDAGVDQVPNDGSPSPPS